MKSKIKLWTILGSLIIFFLGIFFNSIPAFIIGWMMFLAGIIFDMDFGQSPSEDSDSE